MYDIIIVGSGIAGSYLAGKLKKFDVLVIEKDKKIKVKDSGMVSDSIFDFFHGNKLIKDKINTLKLVSQTKSVLLEARKPFAYILEREDLTDFLRNKTEDRTVFETAEKVECSDEFVSVKTNKHEYKTRLLIGADGANSLVRRTITKQSPKLYTGVMNRTNGINHDCIHVYFNKYFSPDFFSWAIPQNNEYGLVTAIRPMEYYNYFKRAVGLPNGKISAKLIPIGTTKSYANRILLIGDSCGHVKPATGGGIVLSLKAAKHAIETIKDAFNDDRFDEENLRYYEWGWKREFGSEISRQMFLRGMYRKMTNPQIDKIIEYFGASIGKYVGSDDFDYDRLSGLLIKMPKIRLLKFLLEYYIFD